jgi:4'-phosphopantetheinyl transferase
LALFTRLDAPLPIEGTHIFLLPLSVAGGEASLPPTDIERAEAEALAPSRRAAFLARRRLLRRATALRLGRAPGDVVIARDANGAPRITSAREPIFVSLASRCGLVAIALSDRPVGVDVEIAAANPPEPAWSILHSREREWLSKQSGQEQAQNFLALWCVKEAYLKAIGLGLRREPAEIAVTLLDKRQVSIEDAGRSVGIDVGCVTRSEAHGAPAILTCVVLTR